MKNLCFSFFFFYTIFSYTNAEAFIAEEYLIKNNSEYSNTLREFNPTFGLQVKFISGVGLTMSNNFNDYSYIHFTLGWYFGIFNFSSSYNFGISKIFDVYGGLFSYLNTLQSGGSKLFVYPEVGMRINISRKLYLETGAILPLNSEDKVILMDVFAVPFIPNIGVRYNLR